LEGEAVVGADGIYTAQAHLMVAVPEPMEQQTLAAAVAAVTAF
jgi:hypothetical protein